MNHTANSARNRAIGLAAVLAVLLAGIAGCAAIADESEAKVSDDDEPSTVAEYDADKSGGSLNNPLTSISLIISGDAGLTYLATNTASNIQTFPATFYYSSADVTSITVQVTSGPSSGDLIVTTTIDGETVGSIVYTATTKTYDVPTGSTIVVSINETKTITFIPASSAYTVTYISSGETYAAETVVSGSTATAPDAPTLSGYVFTGWYTDEDCTELWSFDTAVESDLTLYAGWAEELKFTSNPDLSVVITQTGSVVTIDATTSSNWQSITWYVDGVVVAYGDNVTLDLDGGTYTITATATNSYGSSYYSQEVTVSAPVDDDDTGSESDADSGTDWTFVALIAVGAILGFAALYAGSLPVAVVAVLALAAAVLRWIGLFD